MACLLFSFYFVLEYVETPFLNMITTHNDAAVLRLHSFNSETGYRLKDIDPIADNLIVFYFYKCLAMGAELLGFSLGTKLPDGK